MFEIESCGIISRLSQRRIMQSFGCLPLTCVQGPHHGSVFLRYRVTVVRQADQGLCPLGASSLVLFATTKQQVVKYILF